MSNVAIVLAGGFAGGVLAGLLGVGGGVIFVPALTIGASLAQLDAQATSLAAMVPVVAVGVLRQWSGRELDRRAAVLIGVGSVAGVLAGAQVAEALPDDVLRRLFGVIVLVTAAYLVQREHRGSGST